MEPVRPPRRRCAAFGLIVASAVVLGACGGTEAEKAPPGSPANPLVAELAPGSEASGSGSGGEAAAGGDAESATPGYDRLVDDQARKPPRRFSPCNLVTRAQAAAIAGRPVGDPVEATQGPTCIFRLTSGEDVAAITVQPVGLEALAPQLRGARRSVVSGRTAYCTTRGQAVLYVRVSRSRVLTVVAPCEVARRFALRAVGRLRS